MSFYRNKVKHVGNLLTQIFRMFVNNKFIF